MTLLHEGLGIQDLDVDREITELSEQELNRPFDSEDNEPLVRRLRVPARTYARVEDIAIKRDEGDPESWRNDMLCNELPVELFMPMRYEKAGEWVTMARRACSLCKVLPTCKEDALKNHDPNLFAGGMTSGEREKILNPNHGKTVTA